MKAFYREGKDGGAGLSDSLCFALVRRLLAHNERRSRGAEDAMRILDSIAIHRLKAKGASGYCLVVNDRAVLDNATGPQWDSLLAQCGAVSRERIPTAFESKPFCTGAELYRLVSPVPSDGGEVYHAMLEAREGRFDSLINEVMQLEDARAAVVTLTCGQDRGPMTCVLVEFGEGGYLGGSMESLFPSAEVVRISDNSQRLVFSHLGTTCRWMFSPGNEVVLMPLLSREDSGQSKALVTFRGEDDALEPILCSWRREDESGLGSFVKMRLNTAAQPLLPRPVTAMLAEVSVDVPVVLTRDVREIHDDRRLYVVSESAPAFSKVLLRIVDAAELAGSGAVSFARWVDLSSGDCIYAFQSPVIREFESYRDVRTYRIVETQMGVQGLAVREGFRFMPEMPADEAWVSAVSTGLFGVISGRTSGWAIVDPVGMTDEGFAAVEALIIPQFTPFEGYRKHINVFGPVLKADLIADEQAKHQDLSSRAEFAWNQATGAERFQAETRAREFFDSLEREARQLDQTLLAMRQEVRTTMDMAAPLHEQAKGSRTDLQSLAADFAEGMRAAAAKSSNWAELQKRLHGYVLLLESVVRMLDNSVRTHAAAELERIKVQNGEISNRLAALKLAEAEVLDAHVRSNQLVEKLESEASRVEAEVERSEAAIFENGERVSEFDTLIQKVRSLAAIEHAKALEAMKVRYSEAQCSIREQEAREKMDKLAKSSANLQLRLKRLAVEGSEIDVRRVAVRNEVQQVRSAAGSRDALKLDLQREQKALDEMVKVSDPRVTARHLIVKAKAVRSEIEEVEESIRLLADGDAEIAKLESELAARVAGSSLVSLRANVLGTQKEIEALEKAIGSLEDVLAADSRLHASLAEEGRAATWNAFRAEAEAKLKQARISYLRSRNPRAVPFVEEINAAIEALRQLLKP